MTFKFQQGKGPPGLSGRADLWDGGPASTLLLDDYFGVAAPEWKVFWAEFKTPPAAPPVAGALKAWNGTAWVPGTLKRWNGSAWVAATLKRWNGSSWVTI